MQNEIKRLTSVAIIGAGIAGLTCTRELQAQGLSTVVFEMNHGVGGRMGGLSGPSWQCDHGAQYFTAQSEAFRGELARWEAAGVAQRWAVRLRVLDEAQGPWREPSAHTERYVGVPSMAAPAQFLAQTLAVQLGAHVNGLRREPRGWRLHILGEGWQDCVFDAVVLALPAPQAQTLLRQTTSALQELVGAVTMRPAWALTIRCDDAFDPGFDAAFVNSGPLRWFARNLSKPRRRGDNMWLLHANAAWSDEHREAESNKVAGILIEEFQKLFPVLSSVSSVHRWPFADTESSLGRDYLWDAEQGLGLCGDWLKEAKVEGAWRSAVALAKVMARGSRIKQFDVKTIAIEFDSSVYESALALRNEILRAPLGRSLDFEDLDGEDRQLHFGITSQEDKLIACLSAKKIDEKHYKIRQMAVSLEFQRQGLGALLVCHAQSELKNIGVTTISLHARESAREFYETLGFCRIGELFDEVGIAHIKMQKILLDDPLAS